MNSALASILAQMLIHFQRCMNAGLANRLTRATFMHHADKGIQAHLKQFAANKGLTILGCQFDDLRLVTWSGPLPGLTLSVR